MKNCQLQCQQQELQCKQLAEMKLQNGIIAGNSLSNYFYSSDQGACDLEKGKCFVDICGGKIVIKEFDSNGRLTYQDTVSSENKKDNNLKYSNNKNKESSATETSGSGDSQDLSSSAYQQKKKFNLNRMAQWPLRPNPLQLN